MELLTSLYIYFELKEHSHVNCPMTAAEIALRIWRHHQISVAPDQTADLLAAMAQGPFGICADCESGGYYLTHTLSVHEKILIKSAAASFPLADGRLAESFENFIGGSEEMSFSILRKEISNPFEMEKQSILVTLALACALRRFVKMCLLHIAAEDRQEHGLNEQKRSESLLPEEEAGVDESEILAAPAAFVVQDGKLRVAVREAGARGLTVYSLEDILSVRMTEIAFDEEQVDMESLLAKTEGENGDERISTYLLAVKPASFEEVRKQFPSAQISDNKPVRDGQITVTVEAKEREIFSFILSMPQLAELMAPLQMRFRLKEYFDAVSWIYR